MRKIILSALILISVLASAQTYEMIGQDYEVSYNQKRKTVFFEVESMDVLYTDIEIGVKLSKLNSFIKDIEKNYKKFEEHKDIALENEVQEYTKKIGQSRTTIIGRFSGGSNYHYSNRRVLYFITYISEGVPYLMITTSKITSSTNRFISTDGGFMLLESDEVEPFIEVLKSMYNEADKKQNIDNLFN